MTSSLRIALRLGTRTLHAQAERAGAMRLLLRGELALPDYLRMLRNLLALYEALEAALARHAGDAALAPLQAAQLFRAPALRADLTALAATPVGQAPLTGAAQRYVERLRRLDEDAPALLAAHAYVRYLGDLNGGQVLAACVRRAYALPPGAGLRFYDFGSPAQARAAAQLLAAALDRLPVDAQRSAQLVAEAQLAFSLHVEMFDELACTPPTDAAP